MARPCRRPRTSTPTRTAATRSATRAPAASSCATRSAMQPAPRARRRDALPPPGHRPRPLPALRTRRAHAEHRAARHRRADHQPGPTADWRVAEDGAALRLTSVSSGRQLGVGALRRVAQTDSTAGPLVVRGRHRLRRLPRDRGQRHGRAVQGIAARRRRCAASSTTTSTSAPSTSSAAASTAGVPGARTGSPSRCATASTTSPTASPRWWRTSSPPAAPWARTAPTAGRASPAGRVTSRRPTRAPTGSGSSAPGARACGSWSTTWSRTGRSARSTRSSRTTATR